MKKRLLVLSVFLILALSLSACKDKIKNIEEETSFSDNVNANEDGEVEEIEIVDMAGRTVILPKKINKIATPNVDAYRILVQLDATDLLVGAPDNMYDSKYSDVDTIEVGIFPKVKELTKVGGGPPGSEINIESLIALQPDLIITWSFSKIEDTADRADDLQKKSGLPVIALNNIAGEGTSVDNLVDAYRLMGKITNREERARALVDYYKENIEFVTEKIKKIPAESKARVYNASVGGALNSSKAYLPLIQLDLDNVAKEIGPNGGEVSKEQLAVWDPQIIFLHAPAKNRRANIEDFTNDPTLKNLTAVKENKIYSIKQTYMGWDIATGLTDLYYMAKKSYPELFADIDIEEKGNEILKKFYNTDDLFNILKTNSDIYE